MNNKKNITETVGGIKPDLSTTSLRMRLVSPWTSLAFLIIGILLPYMAPYTSLATECIIFSLWRQDSNEVCLRERVDESRRSAY